MKKYSFFSFVIVVLSTILLFGNSILARNICQPLDKRTKNESKIANISCTGNDSYEIYLEFKVPGKKGPDGKQQIRQYTVHNPELSLVQWMSWDKSERYLVARSKHEHQKEIYNKQGKVTDFYVDYEDYYVFSIDTATKPEPKSFLIFHYRRYEGELEGEGAEIAKLQQIGGGAPYYYSPGHVEFAKNGMKFYVSGDFLKNADNGHDKNCVNGSSTKKYVTLFYKDFHGKDIEKPKKILINICLQ